MPVQVQLPASATDELIVYLADTFTRIGKFRLDPAADGRRAWAKYAPAHRAYGVSYMPEKEDYTAWRCPNAGPPPANG